MADHTSKIITACPNCGKRFSVVAAAAGQRGSCSHCGQQFVIKPEPASAPKAAPAVAPVATSVPAGDASEEAPVVATVVEDDTGADVAGTIASEVQAAAAGGGPLCIVCQTPVGEQEDAVACPDCGGTYHNDCWQYNGGCGVYGCSEAAPTEGLSTLEVPAAHWGKEEKKCPNCGLEILATAVRCRHCGATFSSATPQGSASFVSQQRTEAKIPTVQKISIWLLIFSVVPCTAPVAAVVGVFWYLANRETIRALPAINSAMCKIAVGVALLQTAMMIGFGLLNTIING